MRCITLSARLSGALACLAATGLACHSASKAPAAGDAVTTERTKPFVPSVKCPVHRRMIETVTAQLTDGGEVPQQDEMVLGAVSSAFDKAYDAERMEEALACAQELSRLAPDDSVGHLDRALALEALGHMDEAQTAFDRALAIDPDNSDVLLSAAEFQLDLGTTDSLETAALYAKRGRETEQRIEVASDLAATEAEALNGIGRSAEALSAAESALALNSDQVMALRERGVALFELLRFEEADRALAEARARLPDDAKTFYYSALLAERSGRAADARQFFAAATRLDPDQYPAELNVSRDEFQKIVDEEISGLASTERVALMSTDFSWTDLPSQEDLLAGDPVLSPTIVGVFRPGENGKKDAILVYRKNLLHVVRSRDELRTEVRDTLLHELGHLNGEDDEELRDRGL